ncbi:MAG: glycosyltransferase family 4 protein, partial [Clostridia bacterium]|nr:glycosyltransferase family 4 protein [Clostridia bacterium]
MKVMLLTSEGFDTPNSINHLLIALAEDILRNGNDLYLISSHKTGTYPDTPAILNEYTRFSHSVISRKIIDKNNFLLRYFDEVKYVFSTFKVWIKRKRQIEIVILQSNPLSFLHAIMIRLFLNKPIILNLYDVFPGHAEKIGVIKSRLIYNALRWLQRVLYMTCNRIVVMSEDMKDVLSNENVDAKKILVINNWYDDEIFKVKPYKDNAFMRANNLSEDLFYVQFAGLLGYVFDDQTFLDVAEELIDYPKIRFLLIGDGNQKERIINEIRTRKIDNIDYFPWQPLDIINDVYNACDIGFIPLKDGVIGNGIPSKACQLMALQKVILNSVEDSVY